MSFPFDPSRGPVFVRGEVSAPLGLANLNLILDTVASTSLIRTAILISIGDHPDTSTDRIRVIMGNGVEVIPRVVLNRLTALGQHWIGIPVLSHPLPQEAGVDGLLGLDFLRGSGHLDLIGPMVAERVRQGDGSGENTPGATGCTQPVPQTTRKSRVPGTEPVAPGVKFVDDQLSREL